MKVIGIVLTLGLCLAGAMSQSQSSQFRCFLANVSIGALTEACRQDFS